MTDITAACKTLDAYNSKIARIVAALPDYASLSVEQNEVMTSNFSKDGCFYRSIDIHTMLDCGVSPEMVLKRPISCDIPNSVGVPCRSIIREEFFGGMIYDLDRHKLFYLDMTATNILLLATDTQSSLEIISILNILGVTETDARDSLKDLLTQGLLADTKICAHTIPRIFKSDDLSIPYLQAPFIVELEMTHACYRECKHCAYNASPTANRKFELSTEQWKNAIERMVDAGVMSIRFTGGDFMFRKDAIEILEYTDSLDVAYHFLSDTVALSEKNLRSIQKLKNLSYIGTSIDGPNAETHDWMRGPGAFDLLTERVKRIAALGVKISLGTTLHKNNWHLVRDIGIKSASLGAAYFEVGFLCPIGRGASLHGLVLCGNEIREALRLYTEGVRANEYHPMQLHYYSRAREPEATAFSDISSIIERLPYQTEWPFSRLRVKPDGTTYTAGKLKESGLSIGINIMLDDLRTIWRKSPNLVALREIGMGRRLHSLDIGIIPLELRDD